MADEEKETPALEDLKTMIGLLPSNTSFDETLGLIISNTNLQLKFKLGLKPTEMVPTELAYIPMEVCVKRFNRLKNEGMTSYSQEGETISFNSNDFDDFLDDIAEWKKNNGTGVLTTVDPSRRRNNDILKTGNVL